MQKLLKMLRKMFSGKVLPPPCRTIDRDPYSKQAEYIRRVARQG